jgi:hypothetical protein
VGCADVLPLEREAQVVGGAHRLDLGAQALDRVPVHAGQ